MDDRPVIVRTDESAENFWCRVRPHGKVSPDNGKVLKSRDTPFGRQNGPGSISRSTTTSGSHFPHPTLPRPALAPLNTPLTNSRVIEREVYKNEIAALELKTTPVPPSFIQQLVRQNTDLMRENENIKHKLATTEKRLAGALKINKALATQMSEWYSSNKP